MKKIINYLKTKIELLSFCLIILFSFFIVFYLSNSPIFIYNLSLKIVLLILGIYLFIGYINYKNELTSKEKIELLNKKIYKLESLIIKNNENIKDYFTIWTHQIKTPISVSKLLLDSSKTLDKEKKLKEQLFYISQYTDMALSYLKLIDFDKDMDITEIDLDLVIKELIRKYSMLFIGNNIKLKYESFPKLVITDRKWISILIEQLLSNALKYTRKGYIEILFKNNSLHIIDTGIGIRSEDLSRIFDKGYSGFNGRYNDKSSGIGLYLVRRIAEKLNLKINVNSEINKGSCFEIKFKY